MSINSTGVSTGRDAIESIAFSNNVCNPSSSSVNAVEKLEEAPASEDSFDELRYRVIPVQDTLLSPFTGREAIDPTIPGCNGNRDCEILQPNNSRSRKLET